MKKRLLFIATIMMMVAATTSQADKLVVKQKSGLPPAQLGISPPQINKVVSTSKQERLNQTITIYNYSNKHKKIKLSLIDTDTNKKPIKPSQNTLIPWTIISPKTFAIPPQGQQIIRLSVRPPANFPKKEHHAMLLISQVSSKNPLELSADKKTVRVSLGSSYGLPITLKIK